MSVRLGFPRVTHLRHKNKDVPKVGHPRLVWADGFVDMTQKCNLCAGKFHFFITCVT